MLKKFLICCFTETAEGGKLPSALLGVDDHISLQRKIAAVNDVIRAADDVASGV
jgi:hypothetical protein